MSTTKRAAALLGSAVLAVGATFALAGSASAVTPTYGDAAAEGGILLLNSAGQAVTTGSTTVPFNTIVSKIVAVGGADNGFAPAGFRGDDPNATAYGSQIFIATPSTEPKNPDGTSTDASGFTANSLSSARTQDTAQPVTVASGITASSVMTKIGSNTSTGSFANNYELRLVSTKAPGGAVATTYYAANLLVDTSTNTFTINNGVGTQTGLTASPASPQTAGANGTAPVTLSSTTDPAAAAGTVTFFDGSTQLAAVTPTNGVATTTTNAGPGSHSYTATFTPTDATTYIPSTSAAVPYTVNPGVTPPPAALPEAPYALLIPLSALALGAGLLLTRKVRGSAS